MWKNDFESHLAADFYQVLWSEAERQGVVGLFCGRRRSYRDLSRIANFEEIFRLQENMIAWHQVYTSSYLIWFNCPSNLVDPLLSTCRWPKFLCIQFVVTPIHTDATLWCYILVLHTGARVNAVLLTPGFEHTGRGNGLAVEPTSRNPEFDSSSRQPQVVAHQHWARGFTA